MKIRLFFFLLIIFSMKGYTQQTCVYSPHIRTIQLIVNQDEQAPAIIQLGKNEQIEISFDHLSHEYQRFNYTLTHCNADWNPSDLLRNEYLDGFDENPIEDATISINTTLPYTHYKIALPNEQIQLKLTGNYLLTVYNEEEPHHPILTTCFRVLDKQVNVSAQVSSDTDIDRNKSHQQVSFNILHKGYPIRHPHNEIKVYVLQNQRTDNQVCNLSPSYIGTDQLRYDHLPSLIFPAGNEYRRFEMTSIRYATLGVESIRYHAPYYHVTLHPDEARILNYSYDQDQNGKFIIRNDNAVDTHTEADYFFVHFSLFQEKPLVEGNFYLQGAFTYSGFNEQNLLKFNQDTYAYECVQLLKQGAYNYQYLFVPSGQSIGSTALSEGNFHETENEYTIFIYHRAFGERYDRLIGMQQVKYKN